METVSRTVTYTFTQLSVGDGAVLTYYDDSDAGTASLNSAGWYFSGTIKGAITEYINGTYNNVIADSSNGVYTADKILVDVSLVDENGNAVDVDDGPGTGATYYATFTLSGNTASSGDSYNTYAWSIDLTASGAQTSETSIGDIFYNSGNGKAVSVMP